MTAGESDPAGRIGQVEAEPDADNNGLSRLAEAGRFICQSLDTETVLERILESAANLTRTIRGVIVLEGKQDRLVAIRTFGMSEDAAGTLRQLAGAQELHRRTSLLNAPLRAPDFNQAIREQGITDVEWPVPIADSTPFMFAPLVRQTGLTVSIYLMGRQGAAEFTDSDLETVELLSAYAAVAVDNARSFQREHQARVGFESLYDVSPIAVIVLDAQAGTVRRCNPEAVRIIRRNMGLMGRPTPEVLSELRIRWADGSDTTLAEAVTVDMLQHGEPLRAEEVLIYSQEDRSMRALLNATPILGVDGDRDAMVVTIQDLTPLAEQERLRAEFLAMVSHELRSPLSGVKGAVTNLLDPRALLDPAEVRQFHQIIDVNTDRMRDLISDLLDAARIQAGSLSTKPEPSDLALLIDEARRVFLSAGAEQNLVIEVPPRLPRVMADRQRIIQVVTNLLSNAGRSSPRSSTIRVSAEVTGVHVQISVLDEGRGITAELLPHLFRKFSRVDAEAQGGDTGLGLAISKGIVEAHGGRIWAESGGAGLGARFRFTLPVAEGSAPSEFPFEPVVSDSETDADEEEKAPVLVVDDDPEALRFIRHSLRKFGYHPVLTGDPQQVPDLVDKVKPELILLDLMLPGTDGIALMQQILSTRNVPIIFLSAYGQEDVIARAFDEGADDYLVKPFSATELGARIRAALRKRQVSEPAEPYSYGGLTVDFASRRITLDGRARQFTPIEFRIVALLAARGGKVVDYETLLQQIWGRKPDADMRPLRTAIKSIRRKLGDDAANPRFIFTESLIGYGMPPQTNVDP